MKLLKRCLLIISLLLNLSLTYVYISTYNELNGKINEYEVAVKYLQKNNRREWNISEDKKNEYVSLYNSPFLYLSHNYMFEKTFLKLY